MYLIACLGLIMSRQKKELIMAAGVSLMKTKITINTNLTFYVVDRHVQTSRHDIHHGLASAGIPGSSFLYIFYE